MCKLISVKSAVLKSAVDGTKSAVEGRKKSHTREKLKKALLFHKTRYA
jgi:hypothetical protein